MTTRAGSSRAKNSLNFARESFLRPISPLAASTQCTWKTFLAISTA